MEDMGEIIEAIITEINSAKKKFPEWPVDPVHASAVVSEESGELVQATLDFCYSGKSILEAKNEAIQTAAMAIRFLEGISKYVVKTGY